MRILIIDDDPTMGELLSALFEQRDHNVTVVCSGEDALSVLRSGSEVFDVILSDLHMPGLQGSALTSALSQVRSPSTFLIGMSASQPSPSEAEALDGFLLKPFYPDQFEAAVAAAETRRGDREAASKVTTAPASPEDSGGATANSPVLNQDVFEALRRSLKDDQLREIYELTLSDTKARLDRMQASLDAGDSETVRREAHAIRGSAGMVGATELHLLASATEGGSPGNTPAIAEFRSACDRLKRMLDETLTPS